MNKSNFIQGFFATVEVHTNKVSLDEFYTRFFYHIFYYIFTNFRHYVVNSPKKWLNQPKNRSEQSFTFVITF